MMADKLNKKQIIDLLPHREPMLLIDELINIKKLFSATAIVHVKKDSFFVQGHFPGNPVMPGVLIVEAFGQAAAALTAAGIDKAEYENKLVFLMSGHDHRPEQHGQRPAGCPGLGSEEPEEPGGGGRRRRRRRRRGGRRRRRKRRRRRRR